MFGYFDFKRGFVLVPFLPKYFFNPFVYLGFDLIVFCPDFVSVIFVDFSPKGLLPTQ